MLNILKIFTALFETLRKSNYLKKYFIYITNIAPIITVYASMEINFNWIKMFLFRFKHLRLKDLR